MIIVDGNSLGFSATAGRKMRAGALATQGVQGFLARLIDIRRNYGGKLVVCWDGRSWRYDTYPNYKANRKENPELVALSNEWKAQRPYVGRMLATLGVAQMGASNMEADDLAARIVRQRPEEDHLLVTGDKDWLQLVTPRIVWFDPIRGRTVNSGSFAEFTGVANTMQFVQGKALAGDQGDNIPGVGGIGPKGVEWIMQKYGSVEAMWNASLMGESKEWPKKCRDFADDISKRDAFERNMLLMWLHHPKVPAANKPVLSAKSPQPEAFVRLCEDLAMFTIARAPSRVLDLFNPMKEAA